MNKLAIPSILVATLVLLGIASPVWAANSSVSGSGTFGLELSFNLCPPVSFSVDVTGKQSGAGPAVGTWKTKCEGVLSQPEPLTASINEIVAIGDGVVSFLVCSGSICSDQTAPVDGRDEAWLRGSTTVTDEGLNTCKDSNGNPVTHIILNLKLEEGGANEARIFESREWPAGTVEPVICQQNEETIPGPILFLSLPPATITSGSISVTP